MPYDVEMAEGGPKQNLETSSVEDGDKSQAPNKKTRLSNKEFVCNDFPVDCWFNI